MATKAYLLPPLVRLTDATEFGSWRTPQARDGDPRGQQSPEKRMWPTPTVPNGGTTHHVDQFNGRTAYHKGKKVQVDLNQAVKMWPTPGGSRPNDGDLISGRLANEIGGALNPTWVEWLMGFPLGFTDLDH